jgi:hypothetical protein
MPFAGSGVGRRSLLTLQQENGGYRDCGSGAGLSGGDWAAAHVASSITITSALPLRCLPSMYPVKLGEAQPGDSQSLGKSDNHSMLAPERGDNRLWAFARSAFAKYKQDSRLRTSVLKCYLRHVNGETHMRVAACPFGIVKLDRFVFCSKPRLAVERRARGRTTGRVERRRDRFRPMASFVSALSSIVANSPRVVPSFPPPPLFIPYGGFSPVRLEVSLVLLSPSASPAGGV